MQQQEFMRFIQSYEFINENGRLDLEAFCVDLSSCFAFDHILDISPQPRDMYNLLIHMIRDSTSDDDFKLHVQTQNLIDWTPEWGRYYPDRFRTYIHAGALLLHASDWIYDIGHLLMKIPEPNEDEKYFSWVKEDWVFVHAFINGFHNFRYDYFRKMDKEIAKKSGHSLFEALHKSYSEKIDFDDAVLSIRNRNSAHKQAIKNINKAIDAGFYLEAITLQECIINNSLFNYLRSKKAEVRDSSFQKQISETKKVLNREGKQGLQLLGEVDKWRRSRNKAIHGFVESRIEELKTNQSAFAESSKKTAIVGAELCEKVLNWYLDEAVKFVKTEF